MTTETSGPAPTDAPAARPQQLYRVLAWVGIIAGLVFIVAVVFGSGFVLAGGYHNWHRGPASGQMSCPMMQGGGVKDGTAPGGMPGMMGPGVPGMGQTAPPPKP